MAEDNVKPRHAIRHTLTFPINLPVEKVDLYKWITEMALADYESYSKGHKAMGSFFRDGIFYMVNVENIGFDTLVQNYELKSHRSDYIRFYSPKTKVYIFRWFPLEIGVPWEMCVTSTSYHSCQLTCTIGADFPNSILKGLGWIDSLGGFFLERHLKDEGHSFALDIEKKFK